MQELNTSINSLREVSHYYFDGNGKYIRPMIVLLAAGACNKHTRNKRFVFVHYEELKPVNYIFKVLTGIYITRRYSRRNIDSMFLLEYHVEVVVSL